MTNTTPRICKVLHTQTTTTRVKNIRPLVTSKLSLKALHLDWELPLWELIQVELLPERKWSLSDLSTRCHKGIRKLTTKWPKPATMSQICMRKYSHILSVYKWPPKKKNVYISCVSIISGSIPYKWLCDFLPFFTRPVPLGKVKLICCPGVAPVGTATWFGKHWGVWSQQIQPQRHLHHGRRLADHFCLLRHLKDGLKSLPPRKPWRKMHRWILRFWISAFKDEA